MQKLNILVVGAGNFGTCLAQRLVLNGHNVTLQARSQAVADGINSQHHNPKYLQEFKLEKELRATCSNQKIDLRSIDAVVLAVPTQHLRQALKPFAGSITSDHLLISAAKGVEQNTLHFPSAIIQDVLGKEIAERTVILSGPSFAIEVIQQLPTGVSVASKDSNRAAAAQRIFHMPYFRVYTSSDTVGLEVAGAFKNVIAIAAGACAGLGFQANSKATLITRGLSEIVRVGAALGADPITFNGLGGVGDLFLTCSSEKSRNYSVGRSLGEGKPLEETLNSLGSVAEGVGTAKSAYQLSQDLGGGTPIVHAVYQVIWENRPIQEVVKELLTRDPRDEH